MTEQTEQHVLRSNLRICRLSRECYRSFDCELELARLREKPGRTAVIEASRLLPQLPPKFVKIDPHAAQRAVTDAVRLLGQTDQQLDIADHVPAEPMRLQVSDGYRFA